jgi:murein L,D-transpeptidase YafK
LDRIEHLGNDIFIHGKNVTVGCIPIGDKNIEEVFYLVSKVGKQNTHVIITPVDFRINEKPNKPYGKEWVDMLYKDINDSMSSFIQ